MSAWPRVWCGGPAEPLGAPDLAVTLDVVTKSEANERGFWQATKRKKTQAKALLEALSEALVSQPIAPEGPWCVRFTRLSRARLDDDNLARAFKGMRDQMARVLRVDDGDPIVAFAYAQARATGHGVRVEVWGPSSLPGGEA